MIMLHSDNGTVSVGDVFFSSWSYDFYQVVTVYGKKTITVQQISSERKVSGSDLFYKTPVLNRFIDEPIKED